MVDDVALKQLGKKKSGKVTFDIPTKERIEEAKRKCQEVIESLLEPLVSEELLIISCKFLNQADYLCVIDERNILLLCGYPLCQKELKLIKQKYHISLKSNKVYDITERKCFCSNTCYKASNFLKAQLCTSPIWLKEKVATQEPVKLLCTTQNRGSSGEEVDFGYLRMTANEIEQVPEKEIENSENKHSPHVPDDPETCASAFQNLKISESYTYSIDTDSLESTLLASGEKSQDDGFDDASSVKRDEDKIGVRMTEEGEGNVNSSEQAIEQGSYLDSDDDDYPEESDRLLLDHEKYESLISDNKYMPIIPKEKICKTVILIDPIGNPDRVSSVSTVTEKTNDSLELIKNVLMSWITVETYSFLLGEEFELLKNKIVEKLETNPFAESQTNNVNRLKRMQESYVKMCVKLENEEALELNSQTFENNTKVNPCRDNTQGGQLSEEREAVEQRKVSMFYKGQMGLPDKDSAANKKQAVRKPKSTQRKGNKMDSSGKRPIKMKEMEPVAPCAPREVTVLPVIESLSQSTVRRNIVAHRLKLVYVNILPLIGLQYCDISQDFQLLISTFSLSSENISFKPSEWKMIAVILFRMIERKLTTEKIWSQEKCWQLLEKKLILFCISLEQIDALLASVIDHYHFKKLLIEHIE